MNKKIIAHNEEHLKILIEEEIKKSGNNCDLNHIDVSKVTTLGSLFEGSDFNGDISKWNVSNVIDMSFLFYGSKFNNDISQWDVSNVINMIAVFSDSQFNRDLSNWKPLNLKVNDLMFEKCSAPVPYWSNLDFKNGNEAMVKAINSYQLFNKIDKKIYRNEKKTNIKIKI